MVLEKVVNDFVSKVSITAEAIEAERKLLTKQSKEALKLEREWMATSTRDRKAELAIAAKYASLDAKYPRIDMSFLGEFVFTQNRLTVPKLAVFTPNCGEAKLWLQTGWLGGMRSNVPSVLNYQSEAIAKDTKELAKAEWCSQVVLTAYWGGVIPEGSRSIIKEASKTFDEVLIVAEVSEWQVTMTSNNLLRFAVASRDLVANAGSSFLALIGDPLVIGRKGDVFWLLDKFDTTPLEEYVGNEFTGR
jgi:hypothetical protein